LLGKLWLYQTKARNDWGKGTLTLGWCENKNYITNVPNPISQGNPRGRIQVHL
jgi:hypothetical protein